MSGWTSTSWSSVEFEWSSITIKESIKENPVLLQKIKKKQPPPPKKKVLKYFFYLSSLLKLFLENIGFHKIIIVSSIFCFCKIADFGKITTLSRKVNFCQLKIKFQHFHANNDFCLSCFCFCFYAKLWLFNLMQFFLQNIDFWKTTKLNFNVCIKNFYTETIICPSGSHGGHINWCGGLDLPARLEFEVCAAWLVSIYVLWGPPPLLFFRGSWQNSISLQFQYLASPSRLRRKIKSSLTSIRVPLWSSAGADLPHTKLNIPFFIFITTWRTKTVDYITNSSKTSVC